MAEGMFRRLEGVYPPQYWHECAGTDGFVRQALISNVHVLQDRGIALHARISCVHCGYDFEESVIYPTAEPMKGVSRDG